MSEIKVLVTQSRIRPTGNKSPAEQWPRRLSVETTRNKTKHLFEISLVSSIHSHMNAFHKKFGNEMVSHYGIQNNTMERTLELGTTPL